MLSFFFPRSAFFIIAILDGDCKKGAETRVWFSWTGLSFTWISVNHFWWMNISLNSPRENKTLIRFDTDIRIHVHRVDQLQICWLHSCVVTIIYLEIIACIVIRVILISELCALIVLVMYYMTYVLYIIMLNLSFASLVYKNTQHSFLDSIKTV